MSAPQPIDDDEMLVAEPAMTEPPGGERAPEMAEVIAPDVETVAVPPVQPETLQPETAPSATLPSEPAVVAAATEAASASTQTQIGEAEASVGAAVLASGILRKPNPPANDPLAPIRRMSQAEKIAFFS